MRIGTDALLPAGADRRSLSPRIRDQDIALLLLLAKLGSGIRKLGKGSRNRFHACTSLFQSRATTAYYYLSGSENKALVCAGQHVAVRSP